MENDARQEMLPDGGCVVRFVNGDLKRVEGGTGVVVYTYAAAQTTHTMHPSGLEVFEFPSGQVCVVYVVVTRAMLLLFFYKLAKIFCCVLRLTELNVAMLSLHLGTYLPHFFCVFIFHNFF